MGTIDGGECGEFVGRWFGKAKKWIFDSIVFIGFIDCLPIL